MNAPEIQVSALTGMLLLSCGAGSAYAVTQTFTAVGCGNTVAANVFTVPAGVSSVSIEAAGAPGQKDTLGTSVPGPGDVVSGTLTGLSAGQPLDICVGVGGGAGGHGNGVNAGAGGGASGVALGTDFASVVLIAAGGGGGVVVSGGAAGLPDGHPGVGPGGGGGGTATSFGSGGAVAGMNGARFSAAGPGSGGAGASSGSGIPGGGGGAGYFGGGGGGASSSPLSYNGGGGGSDFCASLLTLPASLSGCARTGPNQFGVGHHPYVTVTTVTVTTQRTLTVSTSGAGSGTVTGIGISCGPSNAGDCSQTVDDGSVIELTASPASGSSFASFTGAGCSMSPCSVTMNASQAIDAHFALNVAPPPPDTTVVSGPAGATNDATPTFTFAADESAATFECRVDSGAFVSCGSPFTTGALGDGAHTFEVRATDAAGNTDASPASQSFSVDTVDPSITGSRVPAANAFGWNDSPVTVKFACTDAGSGIAACEPDVPLVDETLAGGRTISGAALDNVGHSATTTVGPVKIDLTSPTLTAAATEPPNGLGWYRGDVTIAWTAQDGLAGIDAATVPGDTVMHGEGAGLTAGPQTVKDKAGNQASALGPVVNIDRTNPTITAATDPASPNAAGWFNGAVTVTFTCADALSGVKACSGPRVFDLDGTGLSASGVASDNAENTAGASLDAIKIDTHAPQTVAALACNKVNGYCNGSTATVTLAATDPAPAAGVIASGVREIQYRTGGAGAWSVAAADHAQFDIALSGSGTALVEYRAVDNAGNIESVGASRIDYDTIAPTVTHTLNPAANAFGWNNTDLLVHFAATDDNSGVQAATITADRAVNVETAATTIDGQATDVAGNIGKDSVTVKLDKTKPTISATATGTRGANGWYTSVVTVHFTCSDPGPIASQIAACTSDQILDHGQSVTGSATDRADNTAATTFGPVNVDGAKPTIQINGIANGAIYLLHGVPAPSCVATDVGPAGIDGGCQITVTGGLANGVGTFIYTAAAKDKAGNATTVTGSYQVRYAVKTGTAFWLQPINDTAHTVGATTSVFKAGSTVPAKFQLLDANGKTVQANSAPKWLAPVKGGSTAQPIGESVYTDAATTTDVFSANGDQYQYNWATPKTGAGYYWRIGVALDDGTTQTVNIGLR